MIERLIRDLGKISAKVLFNKRESSNEIVDLDKFTLNDIMIFSFQLQLKEKNNFSKPLY